MAHRRAVDELALPAAPRRRGLTHTNGVEDVAPLLTPLGGGRSRGSAGERHDAAARARQRPPLVFIGTAEGCTVFGPEGTLLLKLRLPQLTTLEPAAAAT